MPTADESRLGVAINDQFISSFPLVRRTGKQGLEEIRLPVLAGDAAALRLQLRQRDGQRAARSLPDRAATEPAGGDRGRFNHRLLRLPSLHGPAGPVCIRPERFPVHAHGRPVRDRRAGSARCQRGAGQPAAEPGGWPGRADRLPRLRPAPVR
ncbi:hypothetical protein G6F31_016940 [Rhizopus arrhizus]|nr:hypothetical protein G6F31_016940 [Rhizopus arrhizus]